MSVALPLWVLVGAWGSTLYREAFHAIFTPLRDWVFWIIEFVQCTLLQVWTMCRWCTLEYIYSAIVFHDPWLALEQWFAIIMFKQRTLLQVWNMCRWCTLESTKLCLYLMMFFFPCSCFSCTFGTLCIWCLSGLQSRTNEACLRGNPRTHCLQMMHLGVQ